MPTHVPLCIRELIHGLVPQMVRSTAPCQQLRRALQVSIRTSPLAEPPLQRVQRAPQYPLALWVVICFLKTSATAPPRQHPPLTILCTIPLINRLTKLMTSHEPRLHASGRVRKPKDHVPASNDVSKTQKGKIFVVISSTTPKNGRKISPRASLSSVAPSARY